MAEGSAIPDDDILLRHIPGGTLWQAPGPPIPSADFQLRKDHQETGSRVAPGVTSWGSRRSVRARLTHTARLVMGSLRDGTPSGSPPRPAAGNAATAERNDPTEWGRRGCDDLTISAKRAPPRPGSGATLRCCP